MGTTVVIATHNEGLVGRFDHRQLRIENGTVRLVEAASAPAPGDTGPGDAGPGDAGADDTGPDDTGPDYADARQGSA